MDNNFGSGYCTMCLHTYEECTCPAMHIITTNKTIMDNTKSYWTVTTTHGYFNFTYILTK
jgi:hypothetical protein